MTGASKTPPRVTSDPGPRSIAKLSDRVRHRGDKSPPDASPAQRRRRDPLLQRGGGGRGRRRGSGARRCRRRRSSSSTTTRPTAPATIARGLGVRVVDGPRAGQGVRRPGDLRGAGRPRRRRPGRRRRHLSGRARRGRCSAPVLDGRADMAVGARRPVAEPGAMTPVRGLGNVLIRAAFRVLIGPGNGDLLSGYRVFGAAVPPGRHAPLDRLRDRDRAGRARRWRGGCGWSRSPCRTTRGSPGRPASSGRSATAGGSWR